MDLTYHSASQHFGLMPKPKPFISFYGKPLPILEPIILLHHHHAA